MNIFKFFTSSSPKPPATKPGHFLVLHGEQGAGKTTLARQIAARRGRYAEISSLLLSEKDALGDALSSRPSTLIIDAEGLSHKDLAQLKTLVTSNTLTLRMPFHRMTVRIPAPQVIVCTHDVQPFTDMRRAQLFLVHKD
jgi:predicted P-loop ATPase